MHAGVYIFTRCCLPQVAWTELAATAYPVITAMYIYLQVYIFTRLCLLQVAWTELAVTAYTVITVMYIYLQVYIFIYIYTTGGMD